MITVKTVTAKNFLSVGNATQAVQFNNESLTLVLGENLDQGGDDSGSRNGTGKTTIVNALSYALFGQALNNIKKDNLINKTNGKNMLVTVELEKNGTSYRIERGRKPAVLKFLINNKEQEISDNDGQGDSRETQKDIINLLGGMTHDMFKHIVALNTYTDPFLSLKANDQRVIIEQLLGITLLSEKAELLKEQIKETRDKINQESATIDAIQKSNAHIEVSLNSLKRKQVLWKKQQETDITHLEGNILKLSEVNIDAEISLHEKLKEYNELSAKLSSLHKERSTLESALLQAEKTCNKYEEEIEKLANNHCPMCEQELHTETHEQLLEQAKINLQDAVSYVTTVGNELLFVLNEIDSIGDIGISPKTFYGTTDEAYNHRTNLENLAAQLINKQNETDAYQEQIDELSQNALQEVNWDSINTLNLYKEHQELLSKLLTNKDSFIRKKIIDQNLAYLNNRLTYYLDRIGLPHIVTFQNDLSVEITYLGQDLDFDNLSRGERNRLILSLSWAFRDVWESLYEGVNLLFIDELLDSGLDPNGIENSLSILKQLSRDRNKNIFLISHKEELIGRVNNILKVIKENGFTAFANTTDVVNVI
jgi:DNA repair exonuclease SbcCD ATPase subunit